jgi:membrane-associated HD superfamily phosphohydrolase
LVEYYNRQFVASFFLLEKKCAPIVKLAQISHRLAIFQSAFVFLLPAFTCKKTPQKAITVPLQQLISYATALCIQVEPVA